MLRCVAPILVATLPAFARADSHAVTVVNGTASTVRQIQIAPAGAASPGENRLRSQVPPAREARIAYSTGCLVDVRVTFDGGRMEERRGVDACTDPRLDFRAEPGTVRAVAPTALLLTPSASAPAVPALPVAAASPAAAPAATGMDAARPTLLRPPPAAPVPVPAAAPAAAPATASATAPSAPRPEPTASWQGHSLTKRFGGLGQ